MGHRSRSTVRWRLLGAQAAVVAVMAFALQLLGGIDATVSRDLIDSTFATSPARSVAIRIDTGLADDAAAQSSATASAIDTAFSSLEVDATRTVSGGTSGGIPLLAGPSLRDLVEVTDGAWPDGPAESALQDQAADRLGLTVGDTIDLGTSRVTLTALWRPLDPTAPVWFAEPGPLAGVENGSAGPLIVDESVIATVPGSREARWTLVPGNVGTADLDDLADALEALPGELEGVGMERTYLVVGGTLATTVADLRERIVAYERLATVPVLLVTMLGVVALARVGGLLWAVRRSETVLLRSRGARVSRLVAVGAAEAAVVVALGTVVGSLVRPDIVTAALVAAVTGSVIILTVVAGVVSARPMTARAPGRGRGAVTVGVTILAVAAAGLSLWQFLLYAGRPGADPFGGLAPALGLIAAGLVALLIVPAVFRAGERLAATRPGLPLSLVTRMVSRDAGVHATSVLLIVLATGATVMAGAFATSAGPSESSSRVQSIGADVRIGLDVPPAVDSTGTFVVAADYAPGTIIVLSREARVGDSVIPLVATPEQSATSLRGGSVVTVTVDSASTTGSLLLGVWLVDDRAQPVFVAAADALPLPADRRSVAIDVPQGSWNLLAVEARVQGVTRGTTVEAAVGSVASDSTETAITTDLRLNVVSPVGRAVVTPAPERLPVTLSRATATRLSAKVGDALTVAIPATGSRIEAVVDGLVPAVPGTGSSAGIAVDLLGLERYLVATGQRVAQPNQVLVTGGDAGTVAATAATVSPVVATITRAEGGTRLAAPGSSVMLIGGVVGIALAVIGVVATWSALHRQREQDGATLTALGLPGPGFTVLRVGEFGAVLVVALLLGVAAGALGSALYVPALIDGVVR